MTIRELSCDAFDSTIDGIAKKCSVEGSKKAAIEVASEVFDLTNRIVASIADDGRFDEAEIDSVKQAYRERLAVRIPDESFWFLGTAWAVVKKWLKSVQEKVSAKFTKEG